MYNHLKGNAVQVRPGRVVLEVGGIGWDLHVPLSSSGKIALNREILILVHLVVREDAMTLYGFLTEEERSLFITLIGISGVGAATAVQILSSAEPKEFMLAIEKQDTKFLKKIKGIGEKTAKRIILELKGAKTFFSETDEDTSGGELGGIAADAVKALESMGLGEKEATARVETVIRKYELTGLEEIIRQALQC